MKRKATRQDPKLKRVNRARWVSCLICHEIMDGIFSHDDRAFCAKCIEHDKNLGK